MQSVGETSDRSVHPEVVTEKKTATGIRGEISLKDEGCPHNP